MTESRIVFFGNPWPEGHRIEKFEWTAEIVDGMVWFFFHLETVDYDADRVGDEGPEAGADADWKATTLWGNFHKCSLSATKWGDEAGFPVCSASRFNLAKLSGMDFTVDPLPLKSPDEESRAFHIYLLGHDEVADHRIRFTRDIKTGLFDIRWEGKIALIYSGDYEFRHRFEANIFGVEAPAVLRKKPFSILSLVGL